MSIYSVTEASEITGYSGSRIRYYAGTKQIDAKRRVFGWQISELGISQLFVLKEIATAIKMAGNVNAGVNV